MATGEPAFNPLDKREKLDPPPFPFETRCERCSVRTILGYVRHLDPDCKHSRDYHLTARTEVYFGTNNLDDYCGNALYLGYYRGKTGTYNVLACGKCWKLLLKL